MSSTIRRLSQVSVLAILFGLLALGCGDSSVNSSGFDDSRTGQNNDSNPGSNEYLLVPAGDTELRGNVTESVGIKVLLYHVGTQEPASDKSISFEVLESEDGQNPSLSALNSFTNTSGKSTVDLRLGAAEGQVKVRAQHEDSNAVDFTVDVTPMATGDLDVTLVNTGGAVLQLQDIDVRVYRNREYSCSEFRPLRQREAGDLMNSVVPNTSQTAEFEGLSANNRYLVTAVGMGDRGQIAAGGCVEDISLTQDQTTEKELLLQLVPLNPAGRYDVTSNWDFTQALEESGVVGQTIVRILNIFENPGRAIYDEIINLVQAAVGGIISGTIDSFLDLTGLDDQFENMINTFIENNDALRNIRDAGRDLRDVVADLEVHSELTIGKLGSDYEFRGTDNWLGVTLYWRWNCDSNSPADCGAIDIVADANGQLGSLGVVSSEWTGRVAAYNQLQIDQHPQTLRYGRLIMYILNDVIIPELTDGNANSMSDAFAYWIGCGDLARSITGSDGEVGALGATITDDQIENFCSNAVSTVFGFADLIVNNLEFDLGMRIGGEATMIETTSDGFVDLMEDGTYNGYMQSTDSNTSGQGSPIDATWSAERIDSQTDNL
ncbi:MAG: hypothetical protein ACQEVA_07995 [Myxococcota bacterium]